MVVILAMPRYVKSYITDWHAYMCIDHSVGYIVYRAVSPVHLRVMRLYVY